jgi:hypothetical protein
MVKHQHIEAFLKVHNPTSMIMYWDYIELTWSDKSEVKVYDPYEDSVKAFGNPREYKDNKGRYVEDFVKYGLKLIRSKKRTRFLVIINYRTLQDPQKLQYISDVFRGYPYSVTEAELCCEIGFDGTANKDQLIDFSEMFHSLTFLPGSDEGDRVVSLGKDDKPKEDKNVSTLYTGSSNGRAITNYIGDSHIACVELFQSSLLNLETYRKSWKCRFQLRFKKTHLNNKTISFHDIESFIDNKQSYLEKIFFSKVGIVECFDIDKLYEWVASKKVRNLAKNDHHRFNRSGEGGMIKRFINVKKKNKVTGKTEKVKELRWKRWLPSQIKNDKKKLLSYYLHHHHKVAKIIGDEYFRVVYPSVSSSRTLIWFLLNLDIPRLKKLLEEMPQIKEGSQIDLLRTFLKNSPKFNRSDVDNIYTDNDKYHNITELELITEFENWLLIIGDGFKDDISSFNWWFYEAETNARVKDRSKCSSEMMEPWSKRQKDFPEMIKKYMKKKKRII